MQIRSNLSSVQDAEKVPLLKSLPQIPQLPLFSIPDYLSNSTFIFKSYIF